MPSNHTPNYQLSQWERTDKILMEDFNADNAKIDGALGSLSKTVTEHAELLPKLGNCSVYYGSYIGNGDSNPVVQNLPGRPVFLYVQDGTNPLAIQSIRGLPMAFTVMGADYRYQVFWEDRSVSWTYNAGGLTYSFNFKDRPYFYLILVAEDE